ncbi:uncharacterized protein LY89DRAFT_366521 [Mollisia scopiformis]|uniref:Uncharacterized protein n=1 Tax=Mollisia scopiformis TaxID=149040 RepID=A0A132B6W5_MOLSC|nr:uncharacterized protein LY89DRAFT_366521 [Mollisia scopiformis]KUJ07417.1 hypothetical protein LY89DRAFT_366521 [Mollisia scopiformis]
MKVLTRKHEIAGAEIVKSIRQQLDIMSAIATQIVKDFIADIREEASAGVVALETTAVAGDKHCPDGSFTFRLAEFPSVVIEVVHSQLFKDLRKIAESYILGSKGETRVVLGLDITYKGTKKAPSKRGMVSTWVSNGQGQDVDHPHVVEYGIKKKVSYATQTVYLY